MPIHTTPEANILLKSMYFFEGVSGNTLVEASTRTGKSLCTVFPLPLGWVSGLFRVNGLGADFGHRLSPGAMKVLTPLGSMIAGNHVI